MKTHVEFKSDSFPAIEGEADEVNPGRWGKNLAMFLHAELGGHGLETDNIYAEDWGWVIPIDYHEFPMFVGVGNYEEFPNGFLVFIDPSKPYIKKGFFKKIDTTKEIQNLAQALDAVLTQHSEIYDIRWWS